MTNTPTVPSEDTADLALALILMIARRLGEGERSIRDGHAQRWGYDFMLGRSLRGMTIGLVGMGEIGSAVAERVRSLGMEVVYTSRRAMPANVERERGIRRLDLADLLAVADIVSLHCPLTPETQHLIDAAALSRMKSDAFLINTARGSIIDEKALVDALQAGTIAGAALDVFEREPEVHSGLLDLDNVVLIPHLGSATVETREAMAVLAAENAIEVSVGRQPLTPIPGVTSSTASRQNRA